MVIDVDKKLLTIQQLADALQVSHMTIFRWRKKGMPFKKIGATIRFNYDEVLNWVNEVQEK